MDMDMPAANLRLAVGTWGPWIGRCTARRALTADRAVGLLDVSRQWVSRTGSIRGPVGSGAPPQEARCQLQLGIEGGLGVCLA